MLAYLQDSVTLSAGGKHNPQYPLKNILKYDNNYFYNYSGDYHICKSEDDSWILFDFGPNIMVVVISYLLRSNGSAPCYSHHPKSWKIMGSTDNNEWKLLDRRLNDEHLNGKYKQYHFKCQEKENVSYKNRYRYIKFIQDNNWCDGHGEPVNPFDVYITFFELYGDIYYVS